MKNYVKTVNAIPHFLLGHLGYIYCFKVGIIKQGLEIRMLRSEHHLKSELLQIPISNGSDFERSAKAIKQL